MSTKEREDIEQGKEGKMYLNYHPESKEDTNKPKNILKKGNDLVQNTMHGKETAPILKLVEQERKESLIKSRVKNVE